jgi:hypothetical protein
MKKYFVFICTAILTIAAIVACKKPEPDPDPEPQAPIIANVVMPTEANALPGTDVTIQGGGFKTGDVIKCVGQDGQGDFTPTVKSVTNSAIVIAVPEDASGNYKVTVTRDGKTATLDKVLYIPKVDKLENIVLPSGIVYWGQKLTITGDGIKPTDKIVIECANYPEVEMDNVASKDKIEFDVPVTLYGENIFKIKRDGSLTVLGTVKIGAVAMTAALGGVVFYVSDEGMHGLVVHPEVVSPAEYAWGPSIPMDPFYANTEDGIYKGASNTEKLVKQYNDVAADGNYEQPDKSPAVLCAELEAGGYDDWFLPSPAELIELFKVKATLSEKGLFTVPYNNYWTSLEWNNDAPSWDWAMWYVNFYEAENIVYWAADKVAWKIGTIAMRMF